eukprot:6458667-Amphidinium_carterae.3
MSLRHDFCRSRCLTNRAVFANGKVAPEGVDSIVAIAMLLQSTGARATAVWDRRRVLSHAGLCSRVQTVSQWHWTTGPFCFSRSSGPTKA